MTRLRARLPWLLLMTACATAPPPPPPDPPRTSTEVDENAWRSRPPAPGQSRAFEFPTPVVRQLYNGMKVHVVRRKATTVSLIAITRHGGSSAPRNKSGLAALTTRLMTEGTRKKTSMELAEAVESLGTTLEHDTGRDYSELSLTVLPEDVDRGLEVLVEVVREPAFRNDVFLRVKNQWLDQLRAERQDPRRLASLVGLRLLLGPHQGAPVAGSIPEVENITRTDAVAFHHGAFSPTATTLVIAGDVDVDHIERRTETLVAGWTGGPPLGEPSFTAPESLKKTKIFTVHRPGAQQTSLFVAQPYPKRSAPDHEAREVLNGIVGGLFTSRLNQNLREKHAFTYGARSSTIATRQWGALVVMTSVKTDVTARALEQIFLELELAHNPSRGRAISEIEVGRSRSDLIHSLGAALEHTDDIGDAVSEIVIRDLPPDYLARYSSILERIDARLVTAQAKKYLTPHRLVVVAVGDLEKIATDLKKLGVDVAPADLIALE